MTSRFTPVISADNAALLAGLLGRACGLRYREFALANPHFYAIMFGAMLDVVLRGLAPA